MSCAVMRFCSLAASVALHLLVGAIERGREGIGEMEEGVLLEADIDEHGLQAVLDVFDAAFEDGADDVAVALALDGVFLEHAVFEQGDAALEALGVDDEFVTGLARGQANQAFDAIGHGKKFGVKFERAPWERRVTGRAPG